MIYNGAATLERALRSLRAQTYDDYELIISDDHSADDSLVICRRVTDGDQHVRFIHPERNLGNDPNMRFALSHAKGKYFVWACQDDYWEPEFLECLVNVLEQSPTAVCAQGRVRWFSEDETEAKDLRLYGRDLPERQSRISLAVSFLTRISREREYHLKVKNGVFMHGMWNRAVFSAALNAHGKVFTSERQILCQAALAGEFRYVDKLLFHKQFYFGKRRERFAATEATIVAQATSSAWREVQDTLGAIFRSPIISPIVKLIAGPVLMAAFFRHRSKVKNGLTKMIRKTFRRHVPWQKRGSQGDGGC